MERSINVKDLYIGELILVNKIEHIDGKPYAFGEPVTDTPAGIITYGERKYCVFVKVGNNEYENISNGKTYKVSTYGSQNTVAINENIQTFEEFFEPQVQKFPKITKLNLKEKEIKFLSENINDNQEALRYVSKTNSAKNNILNSLVNFVSQNRKKADVFAN